MKRRWILPMLASGLAIGWTLPPITGWKIPGFLNLTEHGDRSREIQREKLLDILLTQDARVQLKVRQATNLSELLAALPQSASLSDESVIRIVDMDAAAALSQWLIDPDARLDWCEAVATEWAHRNPEATVKFLQTKSSYRAEACMVKVLVAIRWTHPQWVGDVLRGQSRRWQQRNLHDLFCGSGRVRKPGAPLEPSSLDPFEEVDDGYWITKHGGEDFLDALADDALRTQARALWQEDSNKQSPTGDQPPAALDVVHFNCDDFMQCDTLREQLKTQPQHTLHELEKHGNDQARQIAINYLACHVPMESAAWPRALEQLERSMQRLGMIASSPPAHFELGPFLRGAEVARWMSRQPLGLQRAWAPTIAETWVTCEPQATLIWAASLPEDANRELALQTAVMIWAHQNPRDAAAYVESLPAGAARESAIANTAASWACVDRHGVTQWLATMPASIGKSRAIERLK